MTHSHPEGIRGAQAIAGATYLARTGEAKEAVRDYVTVRHGYDLSRTIDEIRPTYAFDVSCQGSVPQAIQAFLESTDYEDAIRNAISIGGDSDTIAAMAGAIAEAAYGIPKWLRQAARDRLPRDLVRTLDRWAGNGLPVGRST